MSNQLLSFYFLLLIFCASVTCDCNLTQKYFIKTTVAGLSLDGSEPSAVKIQLFNGYEPQQWRFECGTKKGLFYIVNVASGTVLTVSNGREVVLSERDGALYQQWYLNYNGRFQNAEYGEVLDVESGFMVAGSLLIIYEDGDSVNQQFILQHVS